MFFIWRRSRIFSFVVQACTCVTQRIVTQSGETSLGLFKPLSLRNIHWHIQHVAFQRAPGFLSIFKHNDAFHLATPRFLLYNKSAHYCISVFVFLREGKQGAGHTEFLMSFTLKSGQFGTHPPQTCQHHYFWMNLLDCCLEHLNLMINAYFYFSTKVQLVISPILLNLFCTW